MADDKQGQSEKLELRSPDPAEARRTEIARLFPEARTEGGKVGIVPPFRLRAAVVLVVDLSKIRDANVDRGSRVSGFHRSGQPHEQGDGND